MEGRDPTGGIRTLVKDVKDLMSREAWREGGMVVGGQRGRKGMEMYKWERERRYRWRGKRIGDKKESFWRREVIRRQQ